ncbi:MAG: transposase family protein [Pleurocapsa sp. MO_192.B19]|nr:transposase family protein [Pleurocapsa sp. MO_192.B19]
MMTNQNRNQSSAEKIILLVADNPGITLSELFETSPEIEADEVYKLIAKEQIYFDLRSSRLVEPEKCHLFRDRSTAESYIALSSSRSNSNTITTSIIDLNPGTLIDYDGTYLTLTLIGQDKVLLQTQNEEPVEFTKDVLETLIRQGKITSLKNDDTNRVSDKARELIQQASQKDLEKANQRYRSIQPYLDGQPIKRGTFQERSLRNWLSAYRKAEQEFGYGYIGLLNFDYQKGNRTRRLPQYVLDLMEDCIKNHYETKKQPTKKSTYAIFVNSCVEAGINYDQIPSDKTFYQEIKKRSGYKQTLKRQGSRAAYDQEAMYWELELTTPRHGNFPFHICHIDHTESDIELKCSKTGKNLGKPWMTFLVDAFSRRILATYVTYNPPSYRSCMMVLRICVKRHGRLPQTIVTDNGKEFHSTYFETLLAMFECTLKHRPAAKSRFSGVCERLFGTTTTQLLNNLAGNTQITKKVRLATKSVNPKNLSLWTIGLLYAHLCEWTSAYFGKFF